MDTEKPALVGGKKYIEIEAADITELLGGSPESEIMAAISCRALFIGNHGNDISGMLYRVSEFILLFDRSIIQVVKFFSVNFSNKYYGFVKGKVCTPRTDKRIHIYSSSPYVICTDNLKIAPFSDIVRKVMLYPDPDNIDSPSFYVVIDFARPMHEFPTSMYLCQCTLR